MSDEDVASIIVYLRSLPPVRRRQPATEIVAPVRYLIRSVPDVLASTANYLKGYGWQPGQPWGEGTANFQVLLQWNASQVYTKTVAYFAQQLAGG